MHEIDKIDYDRYLMMIFADKQDRNYIQTLIKLNEFSKNQYEGLITPEKESIPINQISKDKFTKENVE